MPEGRKADPAPATLTTLTTKGAIDRVTPGGASSSRRPLLGLSWCWGLSQRERVRTQDQGTLGGHAPSPPGPAPRARGAERAAAPRGLKRRSADTAGRGPGPWLPAGRQARLGLNSLGSSAGTGGAARQGGPARQTLLSETLRGGLPLPLGPCGPGGGRLAPHAGHFLLRFRKTGSRRLPSQDPSPCTPALSTQRSASPSLCLPPARYSRRAPGNGPPVGTADAGPSFLAPALGAEGSLHSGIE